jgi:hypothetical protein
VAKFLFVNAVLTFTQARMLAAVKMTPSSLYLLVQLSSVRLVVVAL